MYEINDCDWPYPIQVGWISVGGGQTHMPDQMKLELADSSGSQARIQHQVIKSQSIIFDIDYQASNSYYYSSFSLLSITLTVF